jgi:hypothetical protein
MRGDFRPGGLGISHRASWGVRLLLTLACAMIPVASEPAHAMTPAYNPWFGEVLVADSMGWPPGVQIVTLPPAPNGDVGLEVRNSSATPLYLLSARPQPVGDLPLDLRGINLPPGYVAVQRVELDQAFRWDKPVCPVGRCEPRWVEAGDSIKIEGSAVYSVVPALEKRNKRDGGAAGPRRPADVQVPPGQNAEMRLVYGDRLVLVPVTLTFVVNPEYEQVRAAVEEGQWNLLKMLLPFYIVACLMLLAFAAMFGWVFVWMIRELCAWWRRRFA